METSSSEKQQEQLTEADWKRIDEESLNNLLEMGCNPKYLDMVLGMNSKLQEMLDDLGITEEEANREIE